MKILTGAVLSAMLFAAGPAFADRDDDRGHGKHHWKHSKHYDKHYNKHYSKHYDKHHGHYAPPRYVVRRDVHHYYEPTYYEPVYAPAPVYRPSAGIHVMLPNIYIPLR